MAVRVISRVAGLAALTAAGQLLIVGSLPLYSRVFDPATYGLYVIFVGAFTVLSVLAGVRYDTAIVLPRAAVLAHALTWLVIAIAALVTALVAVVTLCLTLWSGFGAAANVTVFGYGLAVATLIGAVQRCLSSWCVRRGRFLTIGWAQFVLSLSTVMAQLLLVRVLAPLAALVWGFVGALGVQAACLGYAQLHVLAPRGRARESGRGLWVAARKYRRFPTYMVGYALASTARDRLIQLALGFGAGAAAVGRFGLAYRVVFAPNSLVYSAVSPVFYGIASRDSRAEVGRFAAGLVEALFVVLVVPYVVFAIEAPTLTDRVLSPKWHGTGPYLSALAAPALLLAATCWLDRAFDSFRRQRVAFTLEVSFTVAAIAVVAGCAQILDPVSVTWVFAGLALVYYWIYFLVTFVACRFDLGQFWRACASAAITLMVTVVLGALIHRSIQSLWRLPAYGLLMGAVVVLWLQLRGGARVLAQLARARVQGITA